MSESQLTVQRPLVKASSELSTRLGMEVPALIDAMKSQCFKGKRPEEVTDAQLATYISTANALGLNPLLPGQMYAYPDRNGSGVTVMIGPDGVYTLLANNPDIVATKDGGPAWWTEHGVDAQGKETCTGYVNHRTKGLMRKTIWVDEFVVTSNPNWQSRRKFMSETRALKQTARMIIHGMPMDSDERAIAEMVNVTDSGESSSPAPQPDQPKRADAPARKSKGANAAAEAKPADKAIDVETVPPKQETPAEKPAEKVAEQPAPKVPEKPAEKVAAPKADGPITKLGEAETVTVRCKVTKVYALNINVEGVATPSVNATVEGEFVGSVYHFGGGKQTADGVVPESPEWVVGKELRLTLFGRINKKTLTTIAVVKSIALAEEQSDTAAIDV